MMANGGDVSTCWCLTTDFSAVDLIEQYQQQHPQILLDKQQCVCQSCLDKIASAQHPAKTSVQIFTP